MTFRALWSRPMPYQIYLINIIHLMMILMMLPKIKMIYQKIKAIVKRVTKRIQRKRRVMMAIKVMKKRERKRFMINRYLIYSKLALAIFSLQPRPSRSLLIPVSLTITKMTKMTKMNILKNSLRLQLWMKNYPSPRKCMTITMSKEGKNFCLWTISSSSLRRKKRKKI